MDQNQMFYNDYSIPNQTDDVLLESEMTGCQKQFPNSIIPQLAPKGHNENATVRFPDVLYQDERSLTPSSNYRKTERLENIINTDFLSAIPNARLSKTVKRKLTYEDEGHRKVKETFQNPKTYFPFEFIGHASRQSVSQENSVAISKENERRLNPTMISGHAHRKPDPKGNVFAQTAFTTECETPLPERKRTRKHPAKNRSHSTVALEQHFEQIRRKHAEFNWDIPDSQNTVKDDGISSSEVDIQRVPTTPFYEQYTPPSLYSSSEPLVHTSMSWMPIPAPNYSQSTEEYGKKIAQRFAEKVYNDSELWSINNEPTGNLIDATNERHLYPY